MRGQVPAHDPAGTGLAPSGQIAPAPAHQGQIRDIAHPDLVRGGGGELAEQSVFGHHGCRVGHSGAGTVRGGYSAPAARAATCAAHTAPLAFGPQAPDAVASSVARKSGLRRSSCQAATGCGGLRRHW